MKTQKRKTKAHAINRNDYPPVLCVKAAEGDSGPRTLVGGGRKVTRCR